MSPNNRIGELRIYLIRTHSEIVVSTLTQSPSPSVVNFIVPCSSVRSEVSVSLAIQILTPSNYEVHRYQSNKQYYKNHS